MGQTEWIKFRFLCDWGSYNPRRRDSIDISDSLQPIQAKSKRYGLMYSPGNELGIMRLATQEL